VLKLNIKILFQIKLDNTLRKQIEWYNNFGKLNSTILSYCEFYNYSQV